MKNQFQSLREIAQEIGVEIKVARAGDQYKVGIHLLHPTLDELHDALNVAERDLFPAIYIHRGNPAGLKGTHLKLVQS